MDEQMKDAIKFGVVMTVFVAVALAYVAGVPYVIFAGLRPMLIAWEWNTFWTVAALGALLCLYIGSLVGFYAFWEEM